MVIFTVQMLSQDCCHIERSIEFDDGIPIECREQVTRGEISGWLGLPYVLFSYTLCEDMMCFKISYTPATIQTGYFPSVPNWYDAMYWTVTNTPPCTRTLYNYTTYKKTNSTWYSQPFYSTENGYKLQLRVVANGDGLGKGTHLSLYVYLMKGEYDDTLSWPFNANVTVQLLNWSSDSGHREKTIHHYKAPLKCRQRVADGIRAPGGRGYDQFVSHTKIQDASDHTASFINICFRITCVEHI